jgi:aconitase A
VGRAKAVQLAQKAIEEGRDPVEALQAEAAKAGIVEAADADSQNETPEASAAADSAQKEQPLHEQLAQALRLADEKLPGLLEAKNDAAKLGIGSVIFAVKPGDGSAREQAASCQKVLGGWANIAFHYATKRYRSNLINWGMLPLIIPEGDLPFGNGDWILLPDIRAAVLEKREKIMGFAVTGDGAFEEIWLTLGDLTDHERQIIADGCLINFNRGKRK